MPASTLPYPRWLNALKRFERRIYEVEKLICVLSLVVMTFATGFTVLARNMNFNVANYGELGLAALIPLTLVGGAMCTYLGGHIAVDIVQTIGSRLVRNLAEIFAAICTIVFAYFYIYSGYILMEEFRITGDKLLDLGTPLYFLAIFFPIGMGLMVFHAIMRILSRLSGVCSSDEGEVVA